MINNISERNFITECKELKEKSNKIIHILQPQKCKIRKELANEIKQILKLHTTLNRKDLNLNYDSTKIGDIEIKTGDLKQDHTRNNIYDHKILIKSLKDKSHNIWNKRWHNAKIRTENQKQNIPKYGSQTL